MFFFATMYKFLILVFLHQLHGLAFSTWQLSDVTKPSKFVTLRIPDVIITSQSPAFLTRRLHVPSRQSSGLFAISRGYY